jgi:hypothetical protein
MVDLMAVMEWEIMEDLDKVILLEILVNLLVKGMQAEGVHVLGD